MQEHGYYKVSRSGQVLLFSGHGPWNDETMKRGSREMNALIKELDLTKPWAQISCLRGESLMPPSTFQSFEKHTLIRKNMGMTALAVVIMESDIAVTIKQQLTQAYETANIPFEFFDSLSTACIWLSDRGFEIEQKEVVSFCDERTY